MMSELKIYILDVKLIYVFSFCKIKFNDVIFGIYGSLFMSLGGISVLNYWESFHLQSCLL